MEASSWSAPNAGLQLSSSGVTELVMDPRTPATLYAATGSNGVLKSTNGGTSWSAVNTGLPSNSLSGIPAYVLASNPQAPSTLYAHIYHFTLGGVYRTTDGGVSWSRPTDGLVGSRGASVVNTLAINPQTPDIVYAGTSGDGVFALRASATSSEQKIFLPIM